MSFGKQQPAASGPSSLPPKPPPPTRGEPGHRGPRGVVGGGKRRRGGGRGGHGYNAGSGANAQPVSTRGENPSADAAGHGDTDNADGELNPGVKVSFFGLRAASLGACSMSRASRASCFVSRRATSAWTGRSGRADLQAHTRTCCVLETLGHRGRTVAQLDGLVISRALCLDAPRA